MVDPVRMRLRETFGRIPYDRLGAEEPIEIGQPRKGMPL